MCSGLHSILIITLVRETNFEHCILNSSYMFLHGVEIYHCVSLSKTKLATYGIPVRTRARSEDGPTGHGTPGAEHKELPPV
jgi:hypothetical protein